MIFFLLTCNSVHISVFSKRIHSFQTNVKHFFNVFTKSSTCFQNSFSKCFYTKFFYIFYFTQIIISFCTMTSPRRKKKTNVGTVTLCHQNTILSFILLYAAYALKIIAKLFLYFCVRCCFASKTFCYSTYVIRCTGLTDFLFALALLSGTTVSTYIFFLVGYNIILYEYIHYSYTVWHTIICSNIAVICLIYR